MENNKILKVTPSPLKTNTDCLKLGHDWIGPLVPDRNLYMCGRCGEIQRLTLDVLLDKESE